MVNSIAHVDDPSSLGLTPLDVSTLDPFLRGVLLDDCVVTRALRAHASAEVKVSVEEQVDVRVSFHRDLPVGGGSRLARSAPRVSIALDRSPAPTLFAESFVVADRLPPGILASMATSGKGIGEVLEDLGIPTRREVLCLGVSDGVPWRSQLDVGPAVVRLYRIVANRCPAILINEAFLVNVVRGQMRLADAAFA